MKLDKEYVYFNGKKLRYGYTTGSTATAAVKAALTVLLNNSEDLREVNIRIPSGHVLTIPVKSIERQGKYVTATVIKDGGDDPDVTHGLEIQARVSFKKDDRINISGGKGVGKVTKPGLPVEIGKSAINPVPMEMIRGTVKELLPSGRGVDVEIIVPEGKEVSRKTLNAKLGIIGGISILGTTGIVKPMSEESWKSSLAIELKQTLSEYDTDVS